MTSSFTQGRLACMAPRTFTVPPNHPPSPTPASKRKRASPPPPSEALQVESVAALVATAPSAAVPPATAPSANAGTTGAAAAMTSHRELDTDSRVHVLEGRVFTSTVGIVNAVGSVETAQVIHRAYKVPDNWKHTKRSAPSVIPEHLVAHPLSATEALLYLPSLDARCAGPDDGCTELHQRHCPIIRFGCFPRSTQASLLIMHQAPETRQRCYSPVL